MIYHGLGLENLCKHPEYRKTVTNTWEVPISPVTVHVSNGRMLPRSYKLFESVPEHFQTCA